MLNRLSSTTSLDAPEAEQGFDLWEIISFAWRHWKFIASVTVVALVIGAIQVLKETPVYTASAQVLLEPQRERAPGETAAERGDFDFSLFENQIAIIRSTVFLRRVVEKAGFASERGPSPPPSDSFFEKLKSYVFGRASPEQATDAPAAPAPAAQDGGPISPEVLGAIGGLRGATSVVRAGQGSILSISVTDPDPQRAAKLANAIADAYIVEKLDARFEAAQRASTWLSDRLAELRQQLRQSEEAVAQFRSDHGLFQAGTNVTLNQQQLADLNAKLMAAKADTAEKKARYDLLASSQGKGGVLQGLPDAANSSVIGGLRAQEAAISQKEADLVSRYNDRHPLVVNVRAEHRDIERAIAAEMQRIANTVKTDYELAKARESAVEQSLREVTGQTGIDDKTAITLRELERTAAVNKSLFEDFLQKAKITQEQSTFEAREARVITPALPPGAPSYPRKMQAMMIALVVGLVLGVGGAWAKEQLNTGFTTPRQVEDMLEVPLLTSVPTMDPNDLLVEGKAVKLPVYAAAMPLSRFSETMRALRSGIQMTDVDNPPKIVQVTSTIPNEGKTTLSLSLATSAASTGLKVLFIDADLRHSSGSRFFGLQKEHGLVDVLLGTVVQPDVIKYNAEGRLWVLPAGSETRNPADLLGSERMKTFIARCRQSFDLVVIDTPPVGPVIDPIVVAQLADKIVYVVRWASTAREMVQQSIGRLRGHKKLAGVVFNLVNERMAQKYGKHAYQYYYGNRDYRKYYSG